MKISPVQPWSRLSGSSVMLVEVIESCSMEEFDTKEGGSISGLRSFDLKVFLLQYFLCEQERLVFNSSEVLSIKKCSATMGGNMQFIF